MGLWGASQAMAFGLGGFLGAAAIDVMRLLLPDPGLAFAVVFTGEAAAFVAAAWLAARVGRPAAPDVELPVLPTAEAL